MYGLTEIRRFAFPWLRDQLDALTTDQESQRIYALDVLASTCWRWTAPAIRPLLPDDSLLFTEHLLHTIYALDPRLGVEAGLELEMHGSAPHVDVARIFLSQLPPRLLSNFKVPAPSSTHFPDACSPDYLLDRLKDESPITRAAAAQAMAGRFEKRVLSGLFACLNDDSPGVIRGCLEAIKALVPDRALAAGEEAFRRTNTFAHRHAAAEFLIKLGKVGIAKLNDLVTSGSLSEKQAAARALMRWWPDDALAVIRQWVSSPDNEDRGNVVNMIFELTAIELAYPCVDSTRRIECCRDLCVCFLDDLDEYVRSTALVDLAEINWYGWQQRAKDMLADSSSVVRLEALGVVEEKGVPVDATTVAGLLTDPEGCVRQRAFLLLRRLLPDISDLIAELGKMSSSPQLEIRQQLIDMLVQLGRPEGYDVVRRLMKDHDSEVSCEALEAGVSLAPNHEVWLRDVRARCTSNEWSVRLRAINLLSKHGDETHLPCITTKFTDPDEDVREAALKGATNLAPHRKAEFALEILTDTNESVAKAALEILGQCHSSEQLVDIALKKLPRARGESGVVLLDHIQKEDPARWDEALELALRSRSDEARARAAEAIAEKANKSDVTKLKKLLGDRSEDVRLSAFKGLSRLAPEEAQSLAVALLGDKAWSVRQEAVKSLIDDEDPLLLDHLLPLSRDDDEDVRREAIRALAKFDDVRVFSELISSLNDVDEEVREMAQEILNGKHGSVPSLISLSEQYGQSLVERAKTKVDRINRWASRIGQELLGRPVAVQNYRQGLGRTRHVRKREIVTIEVSDASVTSGHPHGEEIMRGLALHEIGHHLFDIGVRGHSTMRGIARSEGVGDIYDILLDERLERLLRSRRPAWGIYLDRLNSYAFAQEGHCFALEDYAKLLRRTDQQTRESVKRGELPGVLLAPSREGEPEKILLRESDMLVIPGLVPPLNAFLAYLLCGFDPRIHPDPKVAEAIRIVPANLKDLGHKDLLELSRKIGELLGKSDQYKRDMQRLRQILAQNNEIARIINKDLDRLAETGRMPEWMRQGAPGIRRNRQIIYHRPRRSRGRSARGFQVLNLGSRLDFDLLEKEDKLPFDVASHSRLVGSIRKHIRRLRSYFERIGTKTVDEYASRRGRRLDLAQARGSIVRKGNPNLLVHSHDEIAPDAYVGVLIDRSGSMEGEKIERAKAFGALVAESLKGLRGIEGHINAFDDDTFIWMGDFRRNSIAALTSGGGNNDAGALARAAELALQSRKLNKLLIMISDGSPSECTFESLKNLVLKLTRDNQLNCAQVAVEELDHIAFPHYVDLSQYSLHEAVSRFGSLLIRLTANWR